MRIYNDKQNKASKHRFGKIIKGTIPTFVEIVPLAFMFKGWLTLLKILQILFSIIAAAFGGCFLFTKDNHFFAYMFLFSGLTMLVCGLIEFNKNKKITGWMLVVVFILSVFVAIQMLY